MKIPTEYNTSINNLLSKGHSSIFLSDWDKQNESHGLDKMLIINALKNSENNVEQYFFIDETNELKMWLSESFSKNSTLKINYKQFALSTNGTASIFLILHGLSMHSKLNVILLSPIYFTYIKLLTELSATIEYIQVIRNGKIDMDYDELEKTIELNKTNIIIINDPLFGTGVTFGINNYEKLLGICKEHNIKLLIDYMYGGMDWDCRPSIINEYFINLSAINQDIIFIESISKRIFLNGLKNSLVFANPDTIKQFETASVHTIGGMCSPQISMCKQIYDISNRKSVLETISNNINQACSNFELIASFLNGTKWYLSNCNSGYFCLLHIPYSVFGNNNNMDIAEQMIESMNILTIPHDRYLYFSKSAYCFRINLTISSDILLTSLNRLLRYFS